MLYTISIIVECSDDPAETMANLDIVLEGAISVTMTDFFEFVAIHDVLIGSSPWEDELPIIPDVL